MQKPENCSNHKTCGQPFLLNTITKTAKAHIQSGSQSRQNILSVPENVSGIPILMTTIRAYTNPFHLGPPLNAITLGQIYLLTNISKQHKKENKPKCFTEKKLKFCIMLNSSQ